jgi:hypothetical protein
MAASTTHSLVASGAKPATEAGALDGHFAQCACGFVAATSLGERFAVKDLGEHVAFMVRKASGNTKRVAPWLR